MNWKTKEACFRTITTITFYFILGQPFKPSGMKSTAPEISSELLCK